MTTLFQRAAEWFPSQAKAANGRTVSVKQGARKVTGITAWMSDHAYEIVDASGFLTQFLATDWTFELADLGTLELREGDVITDTTTGDQYQALDIGTMPAIGKLDGSGVMVLAHTKRIS